ncbi:MAG: hypothetical protein WD847_18870 [Pirellulales bacterium]
MNQSLRAITALLLLSALAAAWADEAKPQKSDKPVEVTSVDHAQSLACPPTSVYVVYRFQLQEEDQFTTIMKTLARNPRIRHLRLRLPNSSHVKEEALDVQVKFSFL